MPIGFNHPGMKEPGFVAKLTRAAIANPANSDVYTVEMAEFVAAWSAGRCRRGSRTCS